MFIGVKATSEEVEYKPTLADGAGRIKMRGDTSYCATLSGKPWPDGLSEVFLLGAVLYFLEMCPNRRAKARATCLRATLYSNLACQKSNKICHGCCLTDLRY